MLVFARIEKYWKDGKKQLSSKSREVVSSFVY